MPISSERYDRWRKRQVRDTISCFHICGRSRFHPMFILNGGATSNLKPVEDIEWPMGKARVGTARPQKYHAFEVPFPRCMIHCGKTFLVHGGCIDAQFQECSQTTYASLTGGMEKGCPLIKFILLIEVRSMLLEKQKKFRRST